jgi:hypothetical protein
MKKEKLLELTLDLCCLERKHLLIITELKILLMKKKSVETGLIFLEKENSLCTANNRYLKKSTENLLDKNRLNFFIKQNQKSDLT